MGGRRRRPSGGRAVTVASPAPGAFPGRPFRLPGIPAALTSTERRAGCTRARARERKNGSAQTLRPGRGAGSRRRGRGGRRASGARPAAVYAQPFLSVHGLPRGSAPAQSPPWAVASARSRPERVGGMREWPPGAGNAGNGGNARRGSLGLRRALGSSQPGGACGGGRLPAGSGGGRWTAGERIAAPLPRTSPALGKRLARILAPVQ